MKGRHCNMEFSTYLGGLNARITHQDCANFKLILVIFHNIRCCVQLLGRSSNPRIIATTVTSSGAKMTQRSSHGEVLQSSDGAGRLIPYLSPIEFYLDPRIPIVLHFHPQKRSWVNSSILLSCRATDGSRDILLINCIKDFSTHFVRSK